MVAHGAALLAALSLSLLDPRPSAAQAPPPRPPLGGSADTNDAAAYLALGAELLVRDPSAARSAFWWAARIDPSAAAATYGLARAIVLASTDATRAVFDGPREDATRQLIRMSDSLDARAQGLDPFLFRAYDRLLLIYYVARRNGINDLSVAQGALERILGDMDAEVQGWYQYSTGRMPEALARYADALRRARDPAAIHRRRGEIYAMLRQPDSAVVELRTALAILRKAESGATSWYEPKAMLEQQIGLLYERGGRLADARAAYGRALIEDLAFHPAHVRLAAMALAAGDTVAAANEFVLAAELAPTDAVVRYQCGYGLIVARRQAEAAEQLRAAVALEPWYAEPRLLLARLADDNELTTEAVTGYREFLARATTRHPQRLAVQRRLATLSAAAPTPSY